MEVKVYIAQKVDELGRPGEVVAVKLTHLAAHQMAKIHAPCKVTLHRADKVADLTPAKQHTGEQHGTTRSNQGFDEAF